MNKRDIKNILITLRTHDNESKINNLLGKVDLLSEEELQTKLREVGDNEEAVKSFFEKRLKEQQHNQGSEHYPLNEMFTYGITNDCVHLHLPGDLHGLIAKYKSVRKAIDTVNLSLLDAIDRIKELKDNGFYRFQDKDSIYMISPILIKRELHFLEEMDFETHTYTDEEVEDEDFLKEHPEAQLFAHIFGKGGGTALISFDTINSKEWQEKKKQKIQEINDKGITLNDNRQKEI